MRKSIVINENFRGHKITVSVMTEQEEYILDDLINSSNSTDPITKAEAMASGKRKFGVDIRAIVSYGIVDENTRLGKYVPKTIYSKGGHNNAQNLLFPSGVTAYKCYAKLYDHATFLGKRRGKTITGVAIHEDSSASVNCLMGILGNPTRIFLSITKNKDDDKE